MNEEYDENLGKLLKVDRYFAVVTSISTTMGEFKIYNIKYQNEIAATSKGYADKCGECYFKVYEVKLESE